MPTVVAKQPAGLPAGVDGKRPVSDFALPGAAGEELIQRDAAGQTLLHYAVKFCEPNLVRRILHTDIYPTAYVPNVLLLGCFVEADWGGICV